VSRAVKQVKPGGKGTEGKSGGKRGGWVIYVHVAARVSCPGGPGEKFPWGLKNNRQRGGGPGPCQGERAEPTTQRVQTEENPSGKADQKENTKEEKKTVLKA